MAQSYTFAKSGDSYIVSIANHAELAEAIMNFCQDQNIRTASILGIGATNQVTLRFYNPATKMYEDKTYNEQMEIANLTGNISEMNGKIYSHLHCTFGRSDYSALAGHLLTARINGACEIVITTYNTMVERYHDEETGLNMFDFK